MKLQIKLRRREVTKEVNLPVILLPLLRRLYASRGIRNVNDLKRSIKNIHPWQQLNGVDKAALVLYKALLEDKQIMVVGDFDTDGATSTALIILCMRAFGYNNLVYMVPNRFEDGYGLSPKIVDRAYILGAQIIITVDNGISSHDGVDRAHALGIQVIITDHHLPDNTLPKADVIVNPNLHYCNFPSKYLAGVGVAFYLMLALRSLLRNKGWFKLNSITMPKLVEYLDLVALGTVADVVPLDTNNRILIWQGLNRIKVGKCRPGIKALLEIFNRDPLQLSTSDLSFALGPLLNAAGRLDNMSIGVALLLCNDISEARELASKLARLNQIRKKIEQKMHDEALTMCKKLEHNGNIPSNGLTIYHPKWHQGVIGILASRIKERFYRPVIAFAPTGDSLLKGSGRSIYGVNMRDLLECLNTSHPGLIIKFGGHAMAVGLLLEEAKFDIFQRLFDKLVNEWIDPNLLQSEIISDGELAPLEMTVETAQLLRDAGPWGHMFPEPLFDGQFYLLQQHIIKERHLKVTLKSINGGPLLHGIIFNVDTAVWPNDRVHKVTIVYKLNINEFHGNYFLQLIIDYIWAI